MELQQFEAYAPVVIRLLQLMLPPLPGAEIDEHALAALAAVQRGGATEVCRWLRQVCDLDGVESSFDARLQAALVVGEPPAGGASHAAWLELRAAAGPGEVASTAAFVGLDEQRTALENFLCRHNDLDPEVLIGALEARLRSEPALAGRLRAAGFSAVFLRELRDYGSLLVDTPDARFDTMLSYCSDDADEALSIWRALEARGFAIWIDREHMLAGDEVIWRLCEVIELLQRYVVCCGENLGRWQRYEVAHMIGLIVHEAAPRRVVPVVLSQVPPHIESVPPPLRSFSRVDLRGLAFDAGIERLVQALRARM